MYSFPNLEPGSCSMSSLNCHFLTCIQIPHEAGQVVWYCHLLKKFSQFVVIHRVKGFVIVNKADVDVFLELSCFFDDPVGVGSLISGSSAFVKSSLNIWKFMVHFNSVQLLSCIWLFVTPWMAARQASLSIPNSRSLPKLMSIELVMPSNHLILCHPLLLLP